MALALILILGLVLEVLELLVELMDQVAPLEAGKELGQHLDAPCAIVPVLGQDFRQSRPVAEAPGLGGLGRQRLAERGLGLVGKLLVAQRLDLPLAGRDPNSDRARFRVDLLQRRLKDLLHPP